MAKSKRGESKKSAKPVPTVATPTLNMRLTIGGREYPCRVTMGAMLRFKRATGKELGAMDPTDPEELITFLWCCVVSACSADGIEFDMTLEEMADRLDPSALDALNAGGESDAAPADSDDSKKKEERATAE